MNLRKVTKISLVNGLLLLLLALSEFSGLIRFPLLLSYEWHKVLHIAGVVLFMGNMVAGPVWFSYAYYSKNKELLKFAGRLLELTDMYLTIPGMALTVINGLFLATAFGGSRNQPWLFYSVILLFVMWALSIPVIYIQEKLYSVIDNDPGNRGKITGLMILWGVIGTLVMIPPTIIFYFMIAKAV
jgi:uncharacterized membrane protein